MCRIKNLLLGLRLVSLLMLGLVHGCAAYKVSSPFLPLQENEQGKLLYQNLTLGVESPADKMQSYELGRFVQDLKKAALFRRVEYIHDSSRADLVLSSFAYKETNVYQACPLGFAGQILTMATVGLIPQICNSTSEISFVLYSPKNVEERKEISFNYQTHTILGWIALVVIPSSPWSAMPNKNERAHLLAAVFLHDAPAVKSILR